MMEEKAQRKRGSAFLFFAIIVLVLSFSPLRQVPAQEVPAAERQFAFAESLFGENDFFRAITEYKRFLFLFPGDRDRAEASQFRIGECYFRAERWQEAVEAFNLFLRKYPESVRVDEALLFRGTAEKKLKQFSEALSSFDAVVERDTGKYRDRGVYEGALLLLEQGDWPQARERFLRVSGESPLSRPAGVYSEGLVKEGDIPVKSPAVAGTLAALLPGAGHLYTDRPKDALMAFLLNGAFIWAAIELFNDGNDVAGGVVTFFELGWYTGNIYSAVSSAHKYNRRMREDFLRILDEQALLSKRCNHERQVLGFAFTIPF